MVLLVRLLTVDQKSIENNGLFVELKLSRATQPASQPDPTESHKFFHYFGKVIFAKGTARNIASLGFKSDLSALLQVFLVSTADEEGSIIKTNSTVCWDQVAFNRSRLANVLLHWANCLLLIIGLIGPLSHNIPSMRLADKTMRTHTSGVQSGLDSYE